MANNDLAIPYCIDKVNVRTPTTEQDNQLIASFVTTYHNNLTATRRRYTLQQFVNRSLTHLRIFVGKRLRNPHIGIVAAVVKDLQKVLDVRKNVVPLQSLRAHAYYNRGVARKDTT